MLSASLTWTSPYPTSCQVTPSLLHNSAPRRAPRIGPEFQAVIPELEMPPGPGGVQPPVPPAPTPVAGHRSSAADGSTPGPPLGR